MMEQSIGNDKQAREALVALHPIGFEIRCNGFYESTISYHLRITLG
ncbi:MAG: hypothetical protein WA364_01350 [Candidatus Nitrosopolaris sp.]